MIHRLGAEEKTCQRYRASSQAAWGGNPTPIEFKIRKKKITIHVERLALQKHKCMKAIVDGDDIHCLMIGASGSR